MSPEGLAWFGAGIGIGLAALQRLLAYEFEPFVEIDPSYYRPTEVDFLQADPSLARTELGWAPEVTFDELVMDMVVSDLAEIGLSVDQARERVVSGLGS